MVQVHGHTLKRIEERLRELYLHAASTSPPTFVNLDMEEYRDLELTICAFMKLLDEPELRSIEAGIVLQAYLPDTFPALQRLTEWANQRQKTAGGEIKIRLVKGANLAMEKVDAALHGWNQAPYETKMEVDANYKRCLDWVLNAEQMNGIRIGLASHNLFDVAWTHLLAEERGVILFDETIRQFAEDGTLLRDIINDQGALPGIKVDKGLQPIEDCPGETVTVGIEHIDDILDDFEQALNLI